MGASPFHRIAAATDGSAIAEHVVTVAIELALRCDAELLIVAVAPMPAVYATPNQPIAAVVLPEETLPRFRGVVDAAVEQARRAGLTRVTGVCEEGPATETILAQARAHGTDLLVVGSRGLSAAERLLLGSVSTALVTHAPCPVLVVRPATPSR
jgi:nucleotide-binding universal stress UspA family protein